MKVQRSKVRRLTDFARSHGWSWTVSRRGNLRLVHASGAGPVFADAAPNDWRPERNALAMLRRLTPG